MFCIQACTDENWCYGNNRVRNASENVEFTYLTVQKKDLNWDSDYDILFYAKRRYCDIYLENYAWSEKPSMKNKSDT